MNRLGQKVILYDIPCKTPGQCWSPNVWRVRLALHYKDIPYDVAWTEYPDIEAAGKELGVTPIVPCDDGSGRLLYTVPMLVDPNITDESGTATAILDSANIVAHLDKHYPERPVLPSGSLGLLESWRRFVNPKLYNEFADLIISKVPEILNERSKEYFIRTRTAWYPEEVMNPNREANWKLVQTDLDKIAAVLDKNGESPSNLEVIPGGFTYADAFVIAPLIWAEVVLDKDERDLLFALNGGRWNAILKHFSSIIDVGSGRYGESSTNVNA